MHAASKILDTGSCKLKRYCGDCMIGLGSSKVIRLIKNTKVLFVKEWILGVLLVYASISLFNAVTDVIKPSNFILSRVPHIPEVKI